MASIGIILILLSDPWRTFKNYWQEYKDWLNTNTTGNYYNWADFDTSTSPQKWKFGASIGIGFIPPGTRKFKIASVSPGLDINLSCKGIWFHVNPSTYVDWGELKNWAISYATNTLYGYLLTYLYSNNTIGQLLNTMNSLSTKVLELDAQRCNDQELQALANDPRWKDLSWSQRLCVNSRMASGDRFSDAIETCQQNAANFIFTGNSKMKSCFDALQLTPEQKELLQALFGYITYSRSGNAVSVKIQDPTITIPEIFDSVTRVTGAIFDSAVYMVNNYGSLNAAQRYSKLYYYLAKMSPPGTAINPQVILEMISAPVTVRQTVKGVIATTNAYYACKMAITLGHRAIYGCMSRNDVQISPTELEELKRRWEAAREEFALIQSNFNSDKLQEILRDLKNQQYYYVTTVLSNNARRVFETDQAPTSLFFQPTYTPPPPPIPPEPTDTL